MIMKKIINIILLAAAVLMAAGCELDNYDAPQGCIYGSILDAETGKPVPLPVEGTTGAIVSIMEVGTGATLAQSFYAKQDGTYRNALIFEGDYTVTASGPFVLQGSQQATVNGETRCDLSAVPYSRIEMNVEQDGMKGKVSFTVTPTDDSYKVKKTYILWNYRKQTDIQNGNFAGSKTDFTGSKTGSHTFNFENEVQYKNNVDKIAENGNKVYVRVAAECEGRVNYSEVYELTLNNN